MTTEQVDLWQSPDLRWRNEFQELLSRVRSWRTTEPYRHQIIGLWEVCRHNRWLLAWEMGTGKSAVIAWRIRIGIEEGHFEKTLIICPLSVVSVWVEELWKHAKIRAHTFMSKTLKADVGWAIKRGPGVWVTNYELARKYWHLLAPLKFGCVVCDESHRIKNTSTSNNRSVRKISVFATHRYALSGTPAPNGALDIHGTLAYLSPEKIPWSKTVFYGRYAVYGNNISPWVRQIVGYKNIDELKKIVSSLSSRVLKSDCLDLPEKTFRILKFTECPAVMAQYKQMKSNYVAQLTSLVGSGELTAANILSASIRLQQILGGFPTDDQGVVHPAPELRRIDMLKELIADMMDQQIVIWCNFRTEVDGLTQMLSPIAVGYHGGKTYNQKEEALQLWKNRKAPIQVLIATPAALREGVNLNNASVAIYYSRTYNLADWLQSIDRIHRIGQKNACTIWSLIANDTIDEKINAALDQKKKVQDLILDRSYFNISEIL